MAKLVMLGTATNVPDENHENTHMVLVGENRMVLIDGPANPYSRMKQAKLDVEKLSDIVMTHFHPDHVAGIPLLLMAFGLSGRTSPINIYANEHCLSLMKYFLEAFEWENWHQYPVVFNLLPEEELYLAIDDEEFQLFTSPVKHFIPAIGLRLVIKNSGKVMAYTGDTAPNENLYALANNAEVLIHEAAGESAGHSSAIQAGKLARDVGAKSLYLVHYPVGDYPYQNLVPEAGRYFSGPISMAEDFDVINL